ncbi:MAG: hypothetical protein LBH28_00545 [Oscillospiraceae bacterium]|nr:hypothetical protein [Oscillospiraceae bacterium]
MKRKRLSAVFGCVLALAVLLGVTVPLARAEDVTVEFLNPLADVEPINNQPLAPRTGWTFDGAGNPDFNGKVVGLSWYTKNINSHILAAIAMKLKEEYPDVIILSPGNVGSIFTSNQLTAANLSGTAIPNSNPLLLNRRLRNSTTALAALSSPWNAKTDANYNQWGGVTTVANTFLGTSTTATTVRVDAMIYGVAD